MGAGLGPRRGDLDPRPGHGGRAVTLPGDSRIVAAADLDALDAALGELRAAGWPAPEHPDSGEDAELDGRDNIADRLSDEVSWLRQCADWLAHLDADTCSYPPAVNLRPSADWPDRAVVAVDLARVAAVIDRIAADVDELARARGSRTRTPPRVLPDLRAAGRAGPGVPGLLRPQGIARLINPATGAGLGRLAGRAIPARRDRPTTRPHRATRSGHADHRPTVPTFRKLDAVAVLTARLLPAPRVLGLGGVRKQAKGSGVNARRVVGKAAGRRSCATAGM